MHGAGVSWAGLAGSRAGRARALTCALLGALVPTPPSTFHPQYTRLRASRAALKACRLHMSFTQTTLGPSVSEGVFSQPTPAKAPGGDSPFPAPWPAAPTLPQKMEHSSSPRGSAEDVCVLQEEHILVRGGGGAGRGGGGEFPAGWCLPEGDWLVQAAHDELCARPSQRWSLQTLFLPLCRLDLLLAF